MYPQICQIGPLHIYSYGFFLALAFLCSSYLAASLAKKNSINPELVFNLCFIGLIFGILGGRILYIMLNFDYYRNSPMEIFKLWNGGLSWFGGLFLGSAAVVVYLKKQKTGILKVLDLIIPFLALAQAIGRIGCLLNGCCYGKEAGWGLYFSTSGRFLIPTQIFSSLTMVVIFMILRIAQERPHRGGAIFYLYLVLYTFKRFFIEFWRADNKIILSGLTSFQLISIIVFFLSLVQLLRKKGT